MIKRATLLLLVLTLLAPCAWAQEAAQPADLLEKVYELNDEETALTVWLPANQSTGYQWSFEISNPDLLELITSEYVGDEAPGGVMGAGGYWAGSFKTAIKTEGMGGAVTLTLRYARPTDPADVEPAETYVFDIWVIENGQLEVKGFRTLEPLEGA